MIIRYLSFLVRALMSEVAESLDASTFLPNVGSSAWESGVAEVYRSLDKVEAELTRKLAKETAHRPVFRDRSLIRSAGG